MKKQLKNMMALVLISCLIITCIGGSSIAQENQGKDISFVKKHSIMEIERVLYGVIVLNEGSLNEYDFYLNDELVFPRKVDKDGVIIKIELKNRFDNIITLINKKINKKEVVFLNKKKLIENKEDKINLFFTSNMFKYDEKTGETYIYAKLDNNSNVEFNETKSFGDVDSMTGASALKSLPGDSKLSINKVDEKTLKITLEGQINQDSTIKVLLLPELFKNVPSTFKGIKNNFIAKMNNTNKKELQEKDHNIIQRASIMEIENVLYGVIVLKEGTLEDYNFYMGHEKLKLSKVNKRGNICKFQLKNRNDLEINISNDNTKETFILK